MLTVIFSLLATTLCSAEIAIKSIQGADSISVADNKIRIFLSEKNSSSLRIDFLSTRLSSGQSGIFLRNPYPGSPSKVLALSSNVATSVNQILTVEVPMNKLCELMAGVDTCDGTSAGTDSVYYVGIDSSDNGIHGNSDDDVMEIIISITK